MPIRPGLLAGLSLLAVPTLHGALAAEPVESNEALSAAGTPPGYASDPATIPAPDGAAAPDTAGDTAPAPSGATPPPPVPVLFTADELIHDRDTGVIRAVGHVEVSRDGRVVVADEIEYQEARDLLTARGNVTLFEPSGEIAFADSMELTGDFREGIVDNLRVILADGARIAAAGGTRAEGNITDMERVVYSPCWVCAEKPEAPLQWQVKALKVRHNQQDKIIEFSNAWIEVRDTPVVYVPYFYIPDPTVKRKTGFLVPSFGDSSDLGTFVKIPFFYAISPEQDLTIKPWLMSEEGALLEAEYRRAFKHGKLETSGLITRDSHQRTRGFIDSTIRYDIDETWRAGLDGRRTTNSTFMQRYLDSNERTLTSRLYTEAFRGKDYFVANAYSFQGLDPDDKQDVIPFAVPYANYSHVSQPDRLGGITNVRLDALALTRRDGLDTRRLSARGSWQRPIVGPVGDLYTVSGTLWTDGYDVSNLERANRSNDFNGTRGRVFPQAGILWQLPMVREGETYTQVIEPMAQIIAAPNNGNPSRIPNEDSQDFEFEDTNVFGYQRYPGLDRVEEGSRANYGASWRLNAPSGRSTSVFVGQVYRFRDDNTFPQNSGLEGNSSDVVAAVQVAPLSYVDLYYRNRLNPTSMDLRRQELTSVVGTEAMNVQTSYVNIESDPSVDLSAREEVDFAINTQLTRMWRSRIFGIRNLNNSGSWRVFGLRLLYEDECLELGAEFKRKNFDDRETEPTNVIMFRVGLKTLGGVSAGGKQGG